MEDYKEAGDRNNYFAIKIKDRNQDLVYDYKNSTFGKEPTPAKN